MNLRDYGHSRWKPTIIKRNIKYDLQGTKKRIYIVHTIKFLYLQIQKASWMG